MAACGVVGRLSLGAYTVAFNPLTDSVAPGCRPKGMPTIIEQPYPMEFVKKGDTSTSLF